MRRVSLVVVLSLLLIQSFAKDVVEQFKDKDRVCFVGDSITHRGDYESFIWLFYLTRFPEREITIFNRGISGDVIGRALSRFNEDIASVKPTVSTVMFGMNDVNRSLYNDKEPTSEVLASRQKSLDNYVKNMEKLQTRLINLNSRIILITPSIFDQSVEAERANNFGVNDALGECRALVIKEAEKNKYPYVDFYQGMNEINNKLQEQDKKLSIIGKDRIHPDANPGHFIMAYLFLKAQNMPKYVSYLEFDAKSKSLVNGENCTVTNMQFADDKITFDLQEKSLPFPVDKDNEISLQLVPFQNELNQQILKVDNLANGNYTLKIDNEQIGVFSSVDLAKGVDLSTNALTPQYKQALKIKQLVEKRRQEEVALRDFYFVKFVALNEYKEDLNDAVAVRAYLDQKLKNVEGSSYHDYFAWQYNKFMRTLPNVEKITKNILELEQEAYQINQPQLHKYSLIVGSRMTSK